MTAKRKPTLSIKPKAKPEVKPEVPSKAKYLKPILAKLLPIVQAGIPSELREPNKVNEIYISDGENIKGVPAGVLVRTPARPGINDKKVAEEFRGKEIYIYFAFGSFGCIIFPHGTEFKELGPCLVGE